VPRLDRIGRPLSFVEASVVNAWVHPFSLAFYIADRSPLEDATSNNCAMHLPLRPGNRLTGWQGTIPRRPVTEDASRRLGQDFLNPGGGREGRRVHLVTGESRRAGPPLNSRISRRATLKSLHLYGAPSVFGILYRRKRMNPRTVVDQRFALSKPHGRSPQLGHH
jgi:hypothetical protein